MLSAAEYTVAVLQSITGAAAFIDAPANLLVMQDGHFVLAPQ